MAASLQLKAQGIHILKLLKQNGPLSFNGLMQMVEPTMKARKLHLSLSRLAKSGMITKRQERVFRGAGVFYQLSQRQLERDKIAGVLDCSSEMLLQPFFRSRELIHSEACSLWANRLRRLFPHASLVRDFEIYNDVAANEVLLTNRNDFELRPDILLTFPGVRDRSPVSVAFEVERSRKSKARLLAKLRKYADESTLDGVVYLCDSTQVSEPVRQIFKAKVCDKSLRISHYGDHFLLFSNSLQVQTNAKMEMFNASSLPVHLEHWIEQLLCISHTARRNKIFEVGGNLLSSLS